MGKDTCPIEAITHVMIQNHIAVSLRISKALGWPNTNPTTPARITSAAAVCNSLFALIVSTYDPRIVVCVHIAMQAR